MEQSQMINNHNRCWTSL